MFGKGGSNRRFRTRFAIAALATMAALVLLTPSHAGSVPGGIGLSDAMEEPIQTDAPQTPEPPAAPQPPAIPGGSKLQDEAEERINGGNDSDEDNESDSDEDANGGPDQQAGGDPTISDLLNQLPPATDPVALLSDLGIEIPEPDVNDVQIPNLADSTGLTGSGQSNPSTAASTQSIAPRAIDHASTGTIIASAAIATGILIAWAAKTGGVGAASVFAGSNLAQAEAGRRVVPSPLFTRFQRETVLNHPKRGELYQLIAEQPGVCLQSLCDASHLSRTAVTHHLRLLEKQHLIVSKRNGRSRHYYQNGGRYGTEMKQAYAVLQNERSQAIADFIHGHPGAIQKSICSRLGIDASVAHWHAKRLEEANLIRTVRQGRTVAYFPSAPLEQIRQTST